jgi:hypothetical protein
MKTNYAGIDYGLGRTNIGAEGIRYGVIQADHVGPAWYDSSEPDYGEPTCPKCGNEAKPAKGEYACYDHAKHECADYVCHRCKYVFGSESAFGETPHAHILDDGEYKAQQGGDDSDIFILKSPYFTYAQFCSPCAPGACYLTSPLETPDPNNKAYCFGHDWFNEDGGKAPYPVYSVATGEPVQPEAVTA